MRKCALEAEYNQCPDLREGQVCGREGEFRCGMEIPEEPPKPVYQHEPPKHDTFHHEP